MPQTTSLSVPYIFDLHNYIYIPFNFIWYHVEYRIRYYSHLGLLDDNGIRLTLFNIYINSTRFELILVSIQLDINIVKSNIIFSSQDKTESLPTRKRKSCALFTGSH